MSSKSCQVVHWLLPLLRPKYCRVVALQIEEELVVEKMLAEELFVQLHSNPIEEILIRFREQVFHWFFKLANHIALNQTNQKTVLSSNRLPWKSSFAFDEAFSIKIGIFKSGESVFDSRLFIWFIISVTLLRFSKGYLLNGATNQRNDLASIYNLMLSTIFRPEMRGSDWDS